MATISHSRFPQRAEQIRALAELEPELRAYDQTWRRKYLQDFTQAFRTYDSVLDSSQLELLIGAASLILVGDYHALPACQNFAAKLLKDCTRSKKRQVVLSLETIFSRDQHIVDEWWSGELGEAELRQRIRYDIDWGYDWKPFYQLLTTARDHAEAVFGLDCMPREDLRKIGARDRHAACKLAEIRERYPDASIIAFIGESHLAPTHLPALLSKQIPNEKVFSILQNVDALYWAAASREIIDVQAVRVNKQTACVFNSTPLEKYESYRLCLDRWRDQHDAELDHGPVIYGLIDSLLRFLDINRYSSRNGSQPKFLVDSFPEVYDASTSQFKKFLDRNNLSGSAETIVNILEQRGCVYLPQFNTLAVDKFHLPFAAEEVSRFVHHACQGLPLHLKGNSTRTQEDRVHCDRLEQALAHLGSKLLHGAMYPASADLKVDGQDNRLGAGLHQAYLAGELSRNDIKRLFLFSVREPGKAAELCSHLNQRLHLNC